MSRPRSDPRSIALEIVDKYVSLARFQELEPENWAVLEDAARQRYENQPSLDEQIILCERLHAALEGDVRKEFTRYSSIQQTEVAIGQDAAFALGLAFGRGGPR